jgi:hypothetical protein
MKKTANALFVLIISSFVAIHATEKARFNVPYKLLFDKAVAARDTDKVISLLTSKRRDLEEKRNNYRLAMKLYRILVKHSPGEYFTKEARYIPIESITAVAKALAIKAKNNLFLKNMPRYIIAEPKQKFDSPQEYEMYFYGAVMAGDIEGIVLLLTAQRKDLIAFRNNDPLAMKLYRILVEHSPKEDFSNTLIPGDIALGKITAVARALAIEGDNLVFLKNMGQASESLRYNEPSRHKEHSRKPQEEFYSATDYKSYFDSAVAQKNIDRIMTLLTSPRKDLIELRRNHPLAAKLYRILMENYPKEDFSNEARSVPIEAITAVAKALAIEGDNDLFLKNMSQ